MLIFHLKEMSMVDRVIQTDLSEKEYKLLRKAVERRRITIKEGLREAVRQWIETQIPVEEDPLFKIEPVRTGVKTDSSDIDRRLYRQ